MSDQTKQRPRSSDTTSLPRSSRPSLSKNLPSTLDSSISLSFAFSFWTSVVENCDSRQHHVVPDFPTRFRSVTFGLVLASDMDLMMEMSLS